VQSLTGVRWWQLPEETDAFACYDLCGPWIPERDWADIVSECFSGCTDFSMKARVERSPFYGDWRSLTRAITGCGSLVHFVKDGPVWATVPDSFDAGIARVIETRQEKERETYFKAVSCGSSPIR